MAVREEYTPYPTARPEFAPTPKIREDFPVVPRTGAVGRALEALGSGMGVLGRARMEAGQAFDSLGQNLKGAGNELWARAVALKQLDDDEKVNKLILETGQGLGKLGEKYRANPNPSEEGLDAHLKQTGDYITAQRKTIDNLGPVAQKRFDDESRGMFHGETRQSIQYTAAQSRASKLATFEARIKQLQSQASKAETQEEYDKYTGMIVYETEMNGRSLGGWNDERTGYETNKNLTDATAGWLSHKAENGESKQAMEILESPKVREQIQEPVYSRLKREIQAKINDDGARNAADRAKQDPDATLAEKLEKGERAIRAWTSDPKALDLTRQRIKGDHGQQHAEQIDQTRRDSDLMEEFAHGRMNPEGKLPIHKEEIEVNADVKAAFHRLENTPGGQAKVTKYLEQLARNGMEDYRPTPESDRLFDHLMGASFDPSKYDEFRDADISALHMPRGQRMELLARKREISKEGQKAMDNPRVGAMINTMRSEGLISQELSRDADAMQTLRGAAYRMLTTYEQQVIHGKANEEQMRTLGQQLLRADPAHPGMNIFGWKFGSTPVYQSMEKSTEYENFVKSAKEGKSGWSDERIEREWGRYWYTKQFEKFFSGGSIGGMPEESTKATIKQAPAPKTPESK